MVLAGGMVLARVVVLTRDGWGAESHDLMTGQRAQKMNLGGWKSGS